eukprot:6281301-Amphidinium_carterae.1
MPHLTTKSRNFHFLVHQMVVPVPPPLHAQRLRQELTRDPSTLTVSKHLPSIDLPALATCVLLSPAHHNSAKDCVPATQADIPGKKENFTFNASSVLLAGLPKRLFTAALNSSSRCCFMPLNPLCEQLSAPHGIFGILTTALEENESPAQHGWLLQKAHGFKDLHRLASLLKMLSCHSQRVFHLCTRLLPLATASVPHVAIV